MLAILGDAISGSSTMSVALVQWGFGLMITVGATALVAVVTLRGSVKDLTKDMKEIQEWRKELRTQRETFIGWKADTDATLKHLPRRNSGPVRKAES